MDELHGKRLKFFSLQNPEVRGRSLAKNVYPDYATVQELGEKCKG